MGKIPTESTADDAPTQVPSVRLASIDLHPQPDGRLVLSITFSPAASELIRALDLAGGGKRPPKAARRDRPAPKAAAEPRVKLAGKARAKKTRPAGWLAAIAGLAGD